MVSMYSSSLKWNQCFPLSCCIRLSSFHSLINEEVINELNFSGCSLRREKRRYSVRMNRAIKMARDTTTTAVTRLTLFGTMSMFINWIRLLICSLCLSTLNGKANFTNFNHQFRGKLLARKQRKIRSHMVHHKCMALYSQLYCIWICWEKCSCIQVCPNSVGNGLYILLAFTMEEGKVFVWFRYSEITKNITSKFIASSQMWLSRQESLGV